MKGKLIIDNYDSLKGAEAAELCDIKITSISKINTKSDNKTVIYCNYKSNQNIFDFGRYYETITPVSVIETKVESVDEKNGDPSAKTSPPKSTKKK
jgi:hypothetical protein